MSLKLSTWILYPAVLLASAVCAAEPETASAPVTTRLPGWQTAPGNTADWVDRLSDTTVNGWSFKDPKNFQKLLELSGDPAIYLEFAKRMQDPEFYAGVIGQAMNPATAKNYMEWSDPAIYMRWMQAFADPNFYATAALSPLNLTNAMHWAAMPIDQRGWSIGLNMVNPAMWMKWMTAPLNPKVMAPLVKVVEPTLPLHWLQEAVNPTNFKMFNGGLTSVNGAR